MDEFERLRVQLSEAEAELHTYMGTWEYAFAMGSSRDGVCAHPRLKAARDRAEELISRCRDLRAAVAEHEL